MQPHGDCYVFISQSFSPEVWASLTLLVVKILSMQMFTHLGDGHATHTQHQSTCQHRNPTSGLRAPDDWTLTVESSCFGTATKKATAVELDWHTAHASFFFCHDNMITHSRSQFHPLCPEFKHPIQISSTIPGFLRSSLRVVLTISNHEWKP